MVDFDATAFNSYWNSIQTDKQDIVLKDVVNGANFRYDIANVSLEGFSNHYSSKGWLGRKLWVILGVPSALISAVCYVFVAVLDQKGKETPKFAALRSLEIAFGHLVTVIDDQKGQYYIQKGLFHVECYMKSYRNLLDESNSTSMYSDPIRPLDNEYHILRGENHKTSSM